MKTIICICMVFMPLYLSAGELFPSKGRFVQELSIGHYVLIGYESGESVFPLHVKLNMRQEFSCYWAINCEVQDEQDGLNIDYFFKKDQVVNFSKSFYPKHNFSKKDALEKLEIISVLCLLTKKNYLEYHAVTNTNEKLIVLISSDLDVIKERCNLDAAGVTYHWVYSTIK